MKLRTKVAISIFALAMISVVSTEYSSSADGKNSNGPAGNTGSPGDGQTCSSCHGPTTVTTGLISSNVPVEGYTPGVTYTITGTIVSAGKTNFGFSMSPQDPAGNYLGTLINTSNATQLNGVWPNNSTHVTHTNSGRTGTTGSHTWSVDWTAPTAGTGDVTFYGIFLVTNNNNNDDSGDVSQREEYVISEVAGCTEPTISGTTPASRCDAGTVTLGATASAGTINWYAGASGGSSLGTGSSFTTPSISSNTDYYVDATDGSCTTTSRTAVTATINTAPTITGTTSDSICETGTINLGATSSSGTINWYAASSGGTSLGAGPNFTTPSISSTTTYYVDADDGSCITPSRTSVEAKIIGLPTITGSSPGSVCNSGTVTLGATSSAGTIDWYAASSGGSSLATGNSYTSPSLIADSIFYVDATSSGCTSATRTAVKATVDPLPTATIAGDATICSGASSIISIALTGTAPWSFTYGSAAGSNPLTGITTSTYTTSVAAGTYTVTSVTDSSGCNGTSSGTAIIDESAAVAVGTSTLTCDGSSTNYTVAFDITGGDAAYTVSGAGTLTGSSFISDAISSGTPYSFSVDDGFGCAPVVVSGNKNCSCAATGVISGGGSICSGSSATVSIEFTGTSPWRFVYSIDGVKQPEVANQTTSPYTFTTTTNATYTLDSIFDATCEGSASGSATVLQTIPTGVISTSSAPICADGSTADLDFAFTGVGPWSFTYSDGITSKDTTSALSSKAIAVSTAGTYSITAVADASCPGTGSGSATIVVNGLPTVTATATSSATVCAGTSVTLTAGGATSYSWSGAITDGASFTPNTTATYTVTGTDGNACTNTAEQTITVNPLPTISVTASPSASICEGESITLTSSGATSYSWTGGISEGQPFTPTVTATFTVTGTDLNACSNTFTQLVTVSTCTTTPTTPTTPPTPTVSRPVPGRLLVSSATAGNQWYLDGVLLTGEIYQTLALSQTTPSGNYTVIVTLNGVSSVPSEPYFIENTNTLVDETTKDSYFSVYPNPNDGSFTVSISNIENENYKLELKNMIGSVLYQEQLTNFSGAYSKSLNIVEFGKGVFILSLTSPKSETIKKIIVY